MKVTITAENLVAGVRRVLNVVSQRTTVPILGNLLLTAKGQRLSLATTDLEVSITTSCPATVTEEGETTLPAKRFGQIVHTLTAGDVVLDTNETHTTTVTSGSAQFKIMGLEAAEFPKEGAFTAERRLSLNAREFGKILRKIHYAVSSDQTRYVLSGILLSVREGNFVAVATDGRRLALMERLLEDPNVTEGDAILPIKVVMELLHLTDQDGDVQIELSDSRAAFTLGDTVVVSKLVEGSYPNYRQVVPQSFRNSVVLPREQFLEVLNRVSVVISDSSASVRFQLTGTTVTFSASASDFGEASEPVTVAYEGEPVTISFNPGFLRDPLRNLEADQLTMRFNDEYKPVVLLGDEGFLYVIMPMRG